MSSTYLQLEFRQGCWTLQDVSRNGTWLREEHSEQVRQLPFGVRMMLPRAGALCLGRPFAEDAEQHFVLSFDTRHDPVAEK